MIGNCKWQAKKGIDLRQVSEHLPQKITRFADIKAGCSLRQEENRVYNRNNDTKN
ncbi:hypothetical protein TUM12151_29300 [Morganella morganii]|nr:hypothetical protein CSB69_1012 [Morganella morganii]EMP50940.1 hypothetical protein C790_01964 [Morganella morganii SC01]ETO42519.1 hypothetical protein X965_02720 [Morganella sp. EGD-HP17]CDK65773.1 hypothetical protein [Morganella morganii IS15]GIZ27241.1 hypothetical protein TUM12149_12110 [Morganella morganii]